MPQAAILLPYLAAILIYVGICYTRENAVLRGSRNFALALVSIFGLGSYLALRVLDLMSVTFGYVYAGIGAVLLIWALISTRI